MEKVGTFVTCPSGKVMVGGGGSASISENNVFLGFADLSAFLPSGGQCRPISADWPTRISRRGKSSTTPCMHLRGRYWQLSWRYDRPFPAE